MIAVSCDAVVAAVADVVVVPVVVGVMMVAVLDNSWTVVLTMGTDEVVTMELIKLETGSTLDLKYPCGG